MKRFCVAYINYFDNDLRQKIVEADSEKSAVIRAFGLNYAFDEATDLEAAKCNAFNADEMFSVIEI